jgi:hypothetical protein
MTSENRKGLVAVLTIALALMTVVACSSTDYSGSNNGGGGTQPTTYSGVVSGASTSGTLSLTIAAYAAQTGMVRLAASTVSVNGTLTLVGGTTVALAGTYDTGTGLITVTGGGYTFTGYVVAGQLQGSWSGNGDSGSFTALVATGSIVTLFCGTYTGTGSGNWNLAQSGSILAGSYKDTNGQTGGYVWGSVNGTTVSLSFGQTVATAIGTATGTLVGPSVSGNWGIPDTTSQTQHGTFSGSTTACGGAR